jgi:hypothetical protein
LEKKAKKLGEKSKKEKLPQFFEKYFISSWPSLGEVRFSLQPMSGFLSTRRN